MQFMPRLMALPALALLSACAHAPASVADAAGPAAADQVSFIINSWGLPQRAWTLDANGNLMVESKAEGGSFVDFDLEQRRTRLSASEAEAVRQALLPARGPLPSCTTRISDAPTVVLSWTGATSQEASIYFACEEEEFRPVIESVMAADERIDRAVAGIAISGRRHIGIGNGM